MHPLDSVSTEKQPQLFPTEVEYLVLEAIRETKGLFSQVHLSWNKSIGVLLNLSLNEVHNDITRAATQFILQAARLGEHYANQNIVDCI